MSDEERLTGLTTRLEGLLDIGPTLFVVPGDDTEVLAGDPHEPRSLRDRELVIPRSQRADLLRSHAIVSCLLAPP